MAKKVLYVGAFELPDHNASSHRVLNNAKIMRTIGYDVIFCGYTREAFDEREVDGFVDYSEKKSNSIIGRVLQLLSIKHIKKVLSAHPDIEYLCCYNLHAFQLFKLMKMCKKRRIKIIGDVTEWNNAPFSLLPLSFFSWLDTVVAMKLLYKKFDSMICISTFLLNYYKKYIKKIILIPPLVDVNDTMWHQTAKNENQYPVFVYAGVPGANKDRLDLVLEALSEAEMEIPYKFYIAGTTRGCLIKKHRKTASSLEKLGDKVIFCGLLSHKDTIAMLKSSDYCFLIREQNRKNMAGFPTKFVECVTCGTRIIATNFSDIGSYADKELVSIVDDMAPRRMAVLISDIVSRNNRITKQVSSDFDYHNYVNEFGKVF